MSFLIRQWHLWWAAWHDDRIITARHQNNLLKLDHSMSRRDFHEDRLLRDQGK